MKIRSVLEKRLKEYGGDAKKAFVNLDENPIWLNEAKGISIKRVPLLPTPALSLPMNLREIWILRMVMK